MASIRMTAATISILTAISSRTSKATMALPRDVSSSFSGGRVGLSDSKALRSRKRALRKDVDSNLKELTKRDIETQTTAVFSHLETLTCLPKAANGGMVSIYLPIEGGKEVNTWPIILRLFEQRTRVVVPKIIGGKPSDMTMVLVPSPEALKLLPLDKWKIPIPDDKWENELSNIDVVIIPCVAVDRSCNRLGHGKGYYDSFIERSTEARRLKGLEAPVTIAIALTEQVLENGVIPLGEFDRKVDFVVTPDGTYHA